MIESTEASEVGIDQAFNELKAKHEDVCAKNRELFTLVKIFQDILKQAQPELERLTEENEALKVSLELKRGAMDQDIKEINRLNILVDELQSKLNQENKI